MRIAILSLVNPIAALTYQPERWQFPKFPVNYVFMGASGEYGFTKCSLYVFFLQMYVFGKLFY
jgi:hypothetical protein